MPDLPCTFTGLQALGATINKPCYTRSQYANFVLPRCCFVLPVYSYNFRTESVKNPRRFSAHNIQSFQLMLSKFELDGKLNPKFSAGRFELAVSSIKVRGQKHVVETFPSLRMKDIPH